MRNITIGGALGSGKSSVGKDLGRILGLEFISTGSIFRRIASDRKLDALETNAAAEDDNTIDEEIDGFIVKRVADGSGYVMDSRMAAHFDPRSFKVYLAVSPEEAARRVMNDNLRKQEFYTTFTGAMESLTDRRNFERERYRKKYGFDIDRLENYDLVVLTDGASKEDIVNCILDAYRKEASGLFYINKRRIVPLMAIRELSGMTDAALPSVSALDPIPLIVDGYFGYALEEPAKIAAALRSKEGMVPVVNLRPQYLARDQNLFDLARKFSPSHFYDWEEISGGKLDITDMVSTGGVIH